MKANLFAITLISFGFQPIICLDIDTTVASIDFPFVDESSWANEPVPADNDPDLARLLEMYNAPEPWDHY